ncbi:hypothetical protein [Streptacidiphilus sp. PAMC 29251]
MIPRMDLALVFAGLDQIPWAELDHAYGSAADVPACLRALAGPDEEAAAQAEQELWSSIVHQGSVYEATAYAVPYLARLAAAGVRRADLLGLLGAIAESADERGVTVPGAPRTAVTEQLPLLVPLLADGEPAVRQCALWAVAQCRPAPGTPALEALAERWRAETDQVVRADLLTARVLVDPVAAADLAVAGLSAQEPAPVRVAAILAGLDTGRPWDGELAALVLDLMPLEQHTKGSTWEREALQYLVERLCEREETDAAIALVDAALRRGVAGHVQSADAEAVTSMSGEAAWAADELARRSRSAPARLLPAMLLLLEHEETADHAIEAVRAWAHPVPEAIPALIRLAAREGDPGDRALAALVSLGAPEAADLLADRLADRPRSLRVACGSPLSQPAPTLPCTPALLGAIRRRLPDPTLSGNEPGQLALLLAGWGPAARGALPELLALLPHHPLPVSRALAVIADPVADGEVIAGIRAFAEAGGESGAEAGRLAAATALHTLIGDAEPLLASLAAVLSGPATCGLHTIQAIGALGDQARPLLPALRAILGEPPQARATTPQLDAAVEAAAIVWKLTGDQDVALPVVLEGLAEGADLWGRWSAIRAANVAALLGPAALPVAHQLVKMLDRSGQAWAAARALIALHPDDDAPAGISRAELIDHILDGALPGASANTAMAAIEALAGLSPATVTSAQLVRLRTLADGDQRIIGSGIQDRLIHDDERLRAATRTLVHALTPR